MAASASASTDGKSHHWSMKNKMEKKKWKAINVRVYDVDNYVLSFFWHIISIRHTPDHRSIVYVYEVCQFVVANETIKKKMYSNQSMSRLCPIRSNGQSKKKNTKKQTIMKWTHIQFVYQHFALLFFFFSIVVVVVVTQPTPYHHYRQHSPSQKCECRVQWLCARARARKRLKWHFCLF